MQRGGGLVMEQGSGVQADPIISMILYWRSLWWDTLSLKEAAMPPPVAGSGDACGSLGCTRCPAATLLLTRGGRGGREIPQRHLERECNGPAVQECCVVAGNTQCVFSLAAAAAKAHHLDLRRAGRHEELDLQPHLEHAAR